MESEALSKRYNVYLSKIIIPRILNAVSLKGIFFLSGAGRLSICRSQPQQAINYYSQAMHAQSQYRNLVAGLNWKKRLL